MISHQHFIDVEHRRRVDRLQGSARIERLFARPSQRRVRRLVGRSMVSIGSRLVSDPVHEPALPRQG